MGQPDSSPGRWVIKALTAYTQEDWREFLQASEARVLEYADLEREDPFDPGPGASCGPDDPLPIDPRTYCGKQFAQFRNPTDVRCDNYWRPYLFVGQIGQPIPGITIGYERMELTYYPNRMVMGFPYGITVKPIAADTPAGGDENKPVYGPYTQKEFEHFYHLTFTGADVASDQGLTGMLLPACNSDYAAPKIPSGTNLKIRIHFLGTDGRHETEENKTRDNWFEANKHALDAMRDAVTKMNQMCIQSNTGFSVSLLNNDIFCGSSAIHNGGHNSYSAFPHNYPFTCPPVGPQADINLFVGERTELIVAFGTGHLGSGDEAVNSGSYGAVALWVGGDNNPAARASIKSCIMYPTTRWYGTGDDQVTMTQHAVPSSIELRGLFLEEIGHCLGLKWDRLSIPVSQTIFHDWNSVGQAAGVTIPDYTYLDKRAYEILYLKFQDGTQVFNTEMKMNDAFKSFREWVKEYNEANGLDTDEGDGDRPDGTAAKCVEVSGIKYPELLDSGLTCEANLMLEHARGYASNIKMIWGDLNGKYTMKSSGGGMGGEASSLQWEKKESLPPKFYLVTGNYGAFGPHDKRWDGTGSTAENYHGDPWDFKWFPNVNGKYMQIWPFDVEQYGIGDSLSDMLDDIERLPPVDDTEYGGGMGDGLGSGGGAGPVVLGGRPPAPEGGEEVDEFVEDGEDDDGCGMGGCGGTGGVGDAHVDDMLLSHAKDGWSPEDYNWDFGADEPVCGPPPPPGTEGYMEIFDASHICWTYPIYLKYAAKAKIYDDGTKLGTGENDIMEYEYSNGSQREDYGDETNLSDTGENGPSLFCVEYLKLFMSYYKKKEGSHLMEPTLGSTFETSDGREGKSMGPTWMIVRGDSLSKGERTNESGLQYMAIEENPELWENEDYVRTCQSQRNKGTCESEHIIWLYATMGAGGRYDIGPTEHKIPPAGGENWRYFRTSEPTDGGKLNLKASENFFRRMIIEKVNSTTRQPGADCRPRGFPE